MHFRWFVFVLVIVLALASLSELAFAEDIYNFQFQKKVAAPVVTPAAEPARGALEPVDRPGWFAGVGFGARAQTNGFDIRNGFSVTSGYRFSKYLGLDADLIFGKGLADTDSHTLVSGGGRVTPIHIKFFDWDLIDLNVLVGILSGMKDSDHSKPRLAAYVGYGIAFNIADRFLLSLDFEAENADLELYRTTYSGIYRF